LKPSTLLTTATLTIDREVTIDGPWGVTSDTFGCFFKGRKTIVLAETSPRSGLFRTRAALLTSLKAETIRIVIVFFTIFLSIVGGVVAGAGASCRCIVEDFIEAHDRLGDRRGRSAQLVILILMDGLCEKRNTSLER